MTKLLMEKYFAEKMDESLVVGLVDDLSQLRLEALFRSSMLSVKEKVEMTVLIRGIF